MNVKQIKLVAYAALILTALNSLFLIRNYQNSRKSVVIDIVRVFNEFNLKKDLERREAIKLNLQSARVDSLKAMQAVLTGKNSDQTDMAALSNEMDSAENRLQQAYLSSDKNINEQVWQRLNSLLTEYGEKYHYSLVIGANGMGTVLYNLKELDKTEELIKFINGKYETGR